ncbi:MAG TPA: RidA family protein [Steroidobacteraceae bacterium]|nr:RidA family protein [Steroidobacteraceae bacterium]
MTTSVITSSRAPEPLGPYPHARRVGNLLFLSGIGPRRRGEKTIPGLIHDVHGHITDHDIEAQCHAVFDNVRYILEEAGSSWLQLVDVTVFLTHLERDFAVYNRVYAEYFGDIPPCRTTVGVARLPGPISIELKCIATIED